MDFTGEEKILMMLYSPGDRPGLYQALGEMRGQLEQMTDKDFDQLDLYPDI